MLKFTLKCAVRSYIYQHLQNISSLLYICHYSLEVEKKSPKYVTDCSFKVGLGSPLHLQWSACFKVRRCRSRQHGSAQFTVLKNKCILR